MRSFADYAFAVQVLPGILSFLLVLSAMPLLFHTIRLRRPRYLPGLLLSLAVSYFVSQFVQECCMQSADTAAALPLTAFLRTLPYVIFPLACLAAAAVQALTAAALYRYRQAHITPMSLKDAADNLPTGICVYEKDGTVLLKNHTAAQLCVKTGGDTLYDGAGFSAKLREGALPEKIRRIASAEGITLLFPDGTAVTVTEQPLPEFDAVMLLSADMTEEYRRAKELEKQRDALQAVSEKLFAFQQNIIQTTAKQEILDAKIRIHDRLGGLLLRVKQYLAADAPAAEGRALLERLQETVRFLQAEEEPEAADEYALMLSTAARLGVTVETEGALPAGEPAAHILAAAIHECLTNTLRHAGGNLLRVCVTEDRGSLTAVFTNNGRQPSAEIRETGGLKSLRILAEEAGGAMEIDAVPEFRLKIVLPKEDLKCHTEY